VGSNPTIPDPGSTRQRGWWILLPASLHPLGLGRDGNGMDRGQRGVIQVETHPPSHRHRHRRHHVRFRIRRRGGDRSVRGTKQEHETRRASKDHAPWRGSKRARKGKERRERRERERGRTADPNHGMKTHANASIAIDGRSKTKPEVVTKYKAAAEIANSACTNDPEEGTHEQPPPSRRRRRTKRLTRPGNPNERRRAMLSKTKRCCRKSSNTADRETRW